ncbi:hypothetical protein E2C01_021335 [Portunus trituberculatus]|uniref:Uncharacterized protein n=1 Tax=Portunus trituberculatus TaxID=210409 RepID=A0A5B7E2F0_PORTR|nr:hypothetical protein [Portunus trituberculatus]
MMTHLNLLKGEFLEHLVHGVNQLAPGALQALQGGILVCHFLHDGCSHHCFRIRGLRRGVEALRFLPGDPSSLPPPFPGALGGLASSCPEVPLEVTVPLAM